MAVVASAATGSPRAQDVGAGHRLMLTSLISPVSRRRRQVASRPSSSARAMLRAGQRHEIDLAAPQRVEHRIVGFDGVHLRIDRDLLDLAEALASSWRSTSRPRSARASRTRWPGLTLRRSDVGGQVLRLKARREPGRAQVIAAQAPPRSSARSPPAEWPRARRSRPSA